MKKLLILLALAGLGASACGGDDGGDTKVTTKVDAGTKADAGPPASRGVQITNLGAACSSTSDCMGASSVSCLKDLGQLGGSIPSGYCTAQCNVDAECGTNGACPVADLGRESIVATLTSTLGVDISTLIASNCFQTCDKTAATPCSRADATCGSLSDLMAGAGGGAGGLGGLGALAASIPELTKTFCFPPVVQGDGGVAQPDAGSVAKILGGLDAGL